MKVIKSVLFDNTAEYIDQSVVVYFNYVYLFMFYSLFLTFSTSAIINVLGFSSVLMDSFLALFIPFLPIIILLYSHFIDLKEKSMKFLFSYLSVFSLSMGLSVSMFLVNFHLVDILRSLLLTSILFLSMSIFGYMTNKNLSSLGSFLIMGLFGLIGASIINLFLNSSSLQFSIDIITILIFSGLISYETQNLKNIFLNSRYDESLIKISLFSSIGLYLSFINIFMAILRLFFERKE
ncbi:MAG: Bax inhibitor-1/YccA family protein [Candidatus Dojkabacteria bacterium]|nr:Bax inhibitor-1/YccA family protein [Candidatus Dojkabacteria bacterium]